MEGGGERGTAGQETGTTREARTTRRKIGSGPGRPAPVLALALIAVASVVAVGAMFAVWAKHEILDTATWTASSTELLESPPIRDAVADYLTGQLLVAADTYAERLPEQLRPLAGLVAGAARAPLERATSDALERPGARAAWERANRLAHEQFVSAVDHESPLLTREGRSVYLDLHPLLDDAAARAGLPAALPTLIPPGVGRLRVMDSADLDRARTAARLLRSLAIALVVLSAVLYAAAVWRARSARRRAVVAVGAGLACAGAVVLALRPLLGDLAADDLATTSAAQAAVRAAWEIKTGLLEDIAFGAIAAGTLIAVVALAFGRRGPARGLLRQRPPSPG